MTNYYMKHLFLITIICSLFACTKSSLFYKGLELNTKNDTGDSVKVSLYVWYYTDEVDSSFFIVKANDKEKHFLKSMGEYNEGKVEYSLNNGQKSTLIGYYSQAFNGDYEFVIRSVDSIQLINTE